MPEKKPMDLLAVRLPEQMLERLNSKGKDKPEFVRAAIQRAFDEEDRIESGQTLSAVRAAQELANIESRIQAMKEDTIYITAVSACRLIDDPHVRAQYDLYKRVKAGEEGIDDDSITIPYGEHDEDHEIQGYQLRERSGLGISRRVAIWYQNYTIPVETVALYYAQPERYRKTKTAYDAEILKLAELAETVKARLLTA